MVQGRVAAECAPSVLQVCQPADGGVANHVIALCTGLRELGWHVEVACSPGALAETLSELGFTVQTLPLVREVSPRKDLEVVRGLRDLVRSERFSLVHGHSAKGGAVARVAAGLAGSPVVYTPHAWSFLVARGFLEKAAYVRAEQALGLLTERIICVSSGELELGCSSLRGCASKMTLVPNGIAPPPTVEASPTDEDYGRDELVVGTLARLSRQKGIEYLLQAADEVCWGRRLRFTVAGGGPDLMALREEISQRGLEDCFELCGPVTDPWAYLSGIDIFVLPSLWEGMPLSLLEAMSYGLPVVATDVGGVRDIISDDCCGAVVPPGDAPALGREILRYADSPRLRRATGAEARARVLEEFGNAKMIARTVEVYSSILAERGIYLSDGPRSAVGTGARLA